MKDKGQNEERSFLNVKFILNRPLVNFTEFDISLKGSWMSLKVSFRVINSRLSWRVFRSLKISLKESWTCLFKCGTVVNESRRNSDCPTEILENVQKSKWVVLNCVLFLIRPNFRPWNTNFTKYNYFFSLFSKWSSQISHDSLCSAGWFPRRRNSPRFEFCSNFSLLNGNFSLTVVCKISALNYYPFRFILRCAHQYAI